MKGLKKMVDIDKIKRRLLVKYPFFGSITVNLNYIESKECTTLGTDGENVYYNSEFLEGLTEDEQTFLFAHEICHVAFNHIERSEGKDKKIWNIAADGVINAFLKKDGLPLVKGAVDIPDGINYNVEELYEKLLKNKNSSSMQGLLNNNSFNSNSQNNIKNKNEQDEETNEIDENSDKKEIKTEQIEKNDKGAEEKNSENDSAQNKCTEKNSQENSQEESNEIDESKNKEDDVGHDTHSMWERVVEKLRKRKSEKQNSEEINSQEENEEEQEIDKQTIGNKENIDNLDEAVRKISKMEEINAFVKNSEDKKENLEALKKEILKKSNASEKATLSVKRKIENVGESKPLIDWRYILRETTELDSDWSYKNATIENGVITPHLEEIQKPETEILLDTSGSISEVLLRNFLRECKNILKTSKLKVGCFDTKFYGFQEIKTEEDIENMKFVGHGGTNFYIAVDAFSNQAENKIIFTDGKGLIPENSKNIIWLVFGDNKITSNGAKVIYITNEQLRQLSNGDGDFCTIF